MTTRTTKAGSIIRVCRNKKGPLQARIGYEWTVARMTRTGRPVIDGFAFHEIVKSWILVRP